MMVDDLHAQVGLPLRSISQFCCCRTVRTLVVAGGGQLQQSCHSGDRGGRALCGHQLEPVYFGWLAAKYAEAFQERDVFSPARRRAQHGVGDRRWGFLFAAAAAPAVSPALTGGVRLLGDGPGSRESSGRDGADDQSPWMLLWDGSARGHRRVGHHRFPCGIAGQGFPRG
jgi:hypothetical protein